LATTPVAITKTNIIQAVWENIRDRLADNVTSVSITGSVTVTIQTYTGAFPEKVANSKSSYPILVVNAPEIDWEPFTLKKKWANGTFTIDIYTTQAESADKFLTAIINSIETYRDSLKQTGKMSFVNLESTGSDHITRGGFTIHNRSCTFSFKYIFTGEEVGA